MLPMRMSKKKKNVAALVSLAALVALYYATPFDRLLGALRGPLGAAGFPLYRAGGAVRQWANGVFNGYSLSQRVALQERSIAELTYALELAGGSTTDSVSALARATVPATVVALNVVGTTRMLLLDAGANAGVVEGAGVATSEGVFVGKVARVFEDVSLLLPAIASGSAVAAQTSRDASIQAVVRGAGGLGLVMELISQDAAIREGDVVVTSALEENTPVGLLIGTVRSVSYTEGELFQEASLAPFVSLSELANLWIFIPRGT